MTQGEQHLSQETQAGLGPSDIYVIYLGLGSLVCSWKVVNLAPSSCGDSEIRKPQKHINVHSLFPALRETAGHTFSKQTCSCG